MAVECYEFIVSGVLGGQFMQNVFHLNINLAGSPDPFTTANEICTLFATSGEFCSQYVGALPGGFETTSYRARRVLPTGGPTQIFLSANIADNNGTRSGQVSATQVSPVMIWITGVNPSKTGRTFLPCVSEDDIDENVYTSGLLTALNDFGNYWTAGGTLGGGSAWAGAILRRATSSANDINNFRVSPVVGTQRRRLHPV